MMEKKTEIAEVLQALSDANGGKLTPEQVVEAAKDPNSPLHDQFVWSDKEAAHKHRLDTARGIIRSVKYIFKDKTRKIAVPMYVRDPDAESREQGYLNVSRMKTDKEKQRDILVVEFQRVQGVFNRAAELAEYFGMQDELEEMQRRIKLMIAEVSGVEGHA